MKKNLILTLFVTLISSPVLAARNAKIDLDTTGVDWMDKIVGLFQSLINLVGGPGILLITFICLVALLCLYLFFPKNAAFPYLFRAAVGLVALFNIPLLITWISGF